MSEASHWSPARVGAIIAAAGSSQRMGGQDKIFAPLCGRPLLSWTVDAFQGCPHISKIVLVVNEKSLELARQLVEREGWSKVKAICPGGGRRRDSVAQGLGRLDNCWWVVIHDGARPCVNSELIQRGLEEAEKCGSAVAAVPVTDTIKIVGEDGLVQTTPQRHSLWSIQTPQVFRFDIIHKAHQRVEGDATDDASLVEQLGYQVKIYMGSYENIKVTTPQDLALVEAYLVPGSREHRG